MLTLDGLANIASGMGGNADKRSFQVYRHQSLPYQQIEARYRSSWLARKVIDLPASEMTRPKRVWQADGADIGKLEELERTMGLWAKLEEALRLGRMGGAVMVLGSGANVGAPLNAETATLDYLHVMSKEEVSLGPIQLDPGSPDYGQPVYYEVLGNSSMVRLHPSRVIPFKGRYVPRRNVDTVRAFWGDSELDAIDDAIRNADAAQNGFAALIEEAKVDIWGIPDLIDMMLDGEREQALIRRFTLSNLMKSNHNAVVKDAQDTWETRQLNTSGWTDIIMTYIAVVAGAASMPATVLLGKSPDGLNATGDGDLQNWERTLDGWRESQLRPALDRIDPMLKNTAGIGGAKVWWAFGPLREATDDEITAGVKAKLDTIKVAIDAGAPAEPLLEVAANVMIESEQFSGLDALMADYKRGLEETEEPDLDEAEAGLTQGSGMAMDSIPGAVKWLKKAIALHEQHMNGEKPTTGKAGEESQMLMMEQMKKALSEVEDSESEAAKWLKRAIALHEKHMSGDAPTTGKAGEKSQMLMMEQMKNALAELEGGGMKSGMKGMAANDAAPRPLCVSRKVKNVADLKAWAKSQGLPELQDDLHVTVAFSRTAVDWIKMGQDYRDFNGKGTGELVVSAGGPRVVEPLGDRTAVLMFANSDLSWRNREMRDLGASWDYEDYHPHISLTGEPVDLSSVEPYRGKIVLGPEIFEDLSA